jgi:ankyrin repeat protein
MSGIKITILLLSLIVAFPAHADVNSKLIASAKKGDAITVKALLGKGAKVNAKDKDGKTSLMWAAKEGHPITAQTLLDKGAEVNIKDKDGRTALMWAAKEDHPLTAQVLLNKGAAVNVKDKDGKTALMWAAIESHPVQELMKINADAYTLIDQDSTNTVKRLLNSGAEVNAKDKDGRTALTWAAMGGYEDTETDIKDKEKLSALIAEVEKGDLITIRVLLANGAELNTKDKDSRTALMWAEIKNRTTIVRALLDVGAKVNGEDKKTGESGLMEEKKKDEIVAGRTLSDKGANVYIKEKDVKNIMIDTVEYDKKDLAKLLGQPKAKPITKQKKILLADKIINYLSSVNRQSIFIALAVAALIIAVGKLIVAQQKKYLKNKYDIAVDIEAKDEDGRTSLIYAAMKGHANVVQILLEKGAEVNAKDKFGNTALTEATKKSYNKDIIRLLKKAGAKE